MEQEWISLNEFMRRNKMGYVTAVKLINERKIEYQKIGTQYKIRVPKNENSVELMESLIRQNEEYKTYFKTLKDMINQVKV